MLESKLTILKRDGDSTQLKWLLLLPVVRSPQSFGKMGRRAKNVNTYSIASEAEFAVLMRQLLRHLCKTLSLIGLMQAHDRCGHKSLH